jgi:DHA3 family multidrug efflux protein-like MFS transporter
MVGTTTGVSFLVTSVISGLLIGLAGMLSVILLALTLTAAVLVHLTTLSIPEVRAARTAGDDSHRTDLRGTIALVAAVPGLLALIAFSTINNFLGGILMALADPYGLSLVSVEVWGLLFGVLSTGFIIGGVLISRWGLGRNPLRTLLLANLVLWGVCSVFALRSSIVLLAVGFFVYLCVVPYAEASEQTVLQKVVPFERQGRVFGFAQSVEQAASPLTAFLISPIAQFVFMPFMTDGAGARLLGPWFGTGPERGMALLFTIAGILGLVLTLVALGSRHYRRLSHHYQEGAEQEAPEPAAEPEGRELAAAA